MVGIVMRQPGALPVWLIAEAIHHRRSGANAHFTYIASQNSIIQPIDPYISLYIHFTIVQNIHL
ncbi:hypothetical protein [Sporosarcina sp. P26b]|uniref:hypothetical protein n=1 Tax=Sporosarcina sp. P26b TaxID=2048253 RepID=UPI00117AD0BA|nr:hypothetical protein [Sporosarcina sp. P26b]